jgi:hypothetical protein
MEVRFGCSAMLRHSNPVQLMGVATRATSSTEDLSIPPCFTGRMRFLQGFHSSMTWNFTNEACIEKSAKT